MIFGQDRLDIAQARIPAVQQELALSTAGLGAASLATGSMLAMPVAGWLSTRFGSRPFTRVTALATCVALTLPALATDPLLLVLAL